MASHLLGKKSPKRKRAFAKDDAIHGADDRDVRKLLGRGKR